MPKQKTHKGAAKRLRATKNGFKFRRAKRGHNTSKATSKLKRHRQALGAVHKSDVSMMERLLRIFVKKRRG